MNYIDKEIFQNKSWNELEYNDIHQLISYRDSYGYSSFHEYYSDGRKLRSAFYSPSGWFKHVTWDASGHEYVVAISSENNA